MTHPNSWLQRHLPDTPGEDSPGCQAAAVPVGGNYCGQLAQLSHPQSLEKGNACMIATIHAFVLSDQITFPSEFCICGVERPSWSKSRGGQGATEVRLP